MLNLKNSKILFPSWLAFMLTKNMTKINRKVIKIRFAVALMMFGC